MADLGFLVSGQLGFTILGFAAMKGTGDRSDVEGVVSSIEGDCL